MSLILGLDFESQGMDPLTTNITEVGAIMIEGINHIKGFESDVWDSIEHERFSYLVYEESYPPQTQEVIDVTGITDDILKKTGQPPEKVFINLYDLVKKADVILAHNAKYDRTIFEQYCKRYSKDIPKKEWVCTIHDVPYPKRFGCKKLSHLALDHGVRMDGRELHRAVSDVELMLELVLINYGLEKVLEYAREPWIYIKADILGPWQGSGGDGGIGKAQAQSIGYNWETPRGDDRSFPKTWVKRIKERQFEEEKRIAPFRVGKI
jgi:DNA polymerase III epsilon subunit-like protein